MWIMTSLGLVNTNQLINIDIEDSGVMSDINAFTIKGYGEFSHNSFIIKRFEYNDNNKYDVYDQAHEYLIQLQEKLNKGDYNI